MAISGRNENATRRTEDAERDEVLRRMLKLPPKENKELKTGTRKPRQTPKTKMTGK
jgi:hypothetical protein